MRHLRTLFATILVGRLLYPFFNSPLSHLFSDPLRHWQTGLDFLHPDVMGGNDPFFYQFFLFVLRSLSADSAPAVLTVCGILCAAQPYGWYRALREVITREASLAGACIIGLVPGFLGVYGYFMTETLLLTLTGFAFWMTLRAARKRTLGAFLAATAVWLLAAHTRIVVLPMAGICLSWLWLRQPQKLLKIMTGGLIAAAITLPAGLHGREALGYFVPMGNLYVNEIYHDSGRKEIALDFGRQGRYGFGCPSYYNPTFYPFSEWKTARTGTVSVVIDTRRGRMDWRAEAQRVRAERALAPLQDRWENLLYLAFGQEWPDNNTQTLIGWMTVWSRWLWLPVVFAVAVCCLQKRYSGVQWLLPVCSLSLMALLGFQSEGTMEGRFRKPVEPVLVAALIVAASSKRRFSAPV